MNALTKEEFDDATSSSSNRKVDVQKKSETEFEEEKNNSELIMRRNLRQRKPELSVDCSLNESFADSQGSPDSEGDILGILDFTPDVVDQIGLSVGHKFTPYCRLFEVESLRFAELMPHVFIRNQPVFLKVVEMEILPSTLNFFNQCSFTIILQHGSTHWTIVRKSKQISSLHNQLRLFKTMVKLPAATSEERERRQSIRVELKRTVVKSEEERKKDSRKNKRLVKFPRKSLQNMDKCTPMDLENYLSNLLHHSLLKSHSSVLEFFEISPVSFVRHLGPKLKEGYVKKRSGGASFFAWCGGQYKRRWLVLRETCIFCISPNGGNIRTVMLIDNGFQVSHGFRHTRITKGLLITNLSRTLTLKCDGEETEKDWSSAIDTVRNNYATDFSLHNKHLSFAPERKSSYSRWYVDGAWYMNDVADLIELAQEEIFITDWWLSPDIYMKRPDLTGRHWKLSEVLKRQAARGVKIFILLYKEVELALGLNSLYSKQTLCQLSPNIKVLRHPDHYKGSLYWAHHEKMVIIDQMHAFVGGIDLCYGRWDDYRHKLVDLGHGGLVTKKTSKNISLGHLILNTHDLLVENVSKLAPERNIQLTEQNINLNVKSKVSDFAVDVHQINDLSNSNDVESHSLRTETPVVSIPLSEINSNVNVQAQTKDVCDNNSIINVNKREEAVTVESSGDENERHLYRKISSSFGANECHSSQTGMMQEPNADCRISSEDDNVFLKDTDENPNDLIMNPDTREYDEDTRIFSSEEQQKSNLKKNRNLKAMKSLGVDIMEEMKEKKREMKYWTGKKVPKLMRSDSFDSEVGLAAFSDEEEVEAETKPKKRLRRKLKMKAKSKAKLSRENRASSTGSLIDLHKELSHEEVNSVHLWLGKDYVNWITKDLHDPHIPFNDMINRQQTPRMPWHDVALYVEGPAARDAARHFIQRWNAVKSEKTKNNTRYPYLIPKTYKPSSFVPSFLEPKHRVKCQVVRSIGSWSGGQCETERSIYNAYIDAIKNARHFIYIENQFFITSSTVGRNEVVNNIAYHLYERILKAHKRGEIFRVYIVLPLLPAFEGQIGTPSGVAMQYILHYTYQSIISGPNSLLGMLRAEGVTWQHYLCFCSLRTHDILEGQFVSELIYVHSKLLIIDDRLVIAGSANINDRSLLGHRDSEVDLIIEDEDFIEGIMNGKKYMRGEFAGGLRTYLFSEHLGLSEDSSIDVSDPVCEQFFMRSWLAIASRNTKIYDEVFSCIPNDATKNFADLKKLRSQKSLAKRNHEAAQEKLKRIQGRLVMYPLMFLKDEDIKPGPNRKEFLLPIEMWL